jgi:hypothetical protein
VELEIRTGKLLTGERLGRSYLERLRSINGEQVREPYGGGELTSTQLQEVA